jgi:hypothetical protein
VSVAGQVAAGAVALAALGIVCICLLAAMIDDATSERNQRPRRGKGMK